MKSLNPLFWALFDIPTLFSHLFTHCFFQVPSYTKTQKHNFLLSFLGLLISTLITNENMQRHGETQKCTNFRTFSSITSFFFLCTKFALSCILCLMLCLNTSCCPPFGKFYEFGCTSFKTINPFFHPKCNWDLSKHYWQVFGTPHIINNEFHKGYIAQEKRKKVKWAKAIASTKCKKSRRYETQLVKGGGLMAFSNKNEVGNFFGRLNVMCKFASPFLINGARANK